MPRVRSSAELASILIIESDPPTLEMYRRELSREFTVLACEDEVEVLDLICSKDISAVVLEPALAGNDGWRLLAVLREALAGRRVPIILCSTQDDRKRGMAEGAAAFLVKPVLPVELHETIRRILSQTRE